MSALNKVNVENSPTQSTFAALGEPSPEPGQLAEQLFTSNLPAFNWTTRQIATATLTVVGVLLLFGLLYRFYSVVFIFFVAFALQIAIRPVTGWLHSRWGVRPEVGVVVVYASLFIGLVVATWYLIPVLFTQANRVVQQIPAYYDLILNWLTKSPSPLLQQVAGLLPAQPAQLTTLLTPVQAAENPITSTWQMVKSVIYAFFVFLVILLLAFFWTREGELITRRLVLLTPMERRDEVRLLLGEVERKIGAYFRGQLLLCVAVGALSLLAFLLIGVPSALLLGLLMGIFEAVPVLGPTLGAIPAILMTLTVAPDKVFWVVAALVLIQVLENNLLVPRVMDQSVGVNALVTILAIAAFGLLFGLIGAILAIPLAAILQILLDRFLFQEILPEETPKLPVDTNTVGRGQVSVLRLAAQELVQDLRKQTRQPQEGDKSPEVERVEDLIEAISADLDSLLAAREGKA